MYENPGEYLYALNTWGAEYEDDAPDEGYYGAVTYVGEYCVVTGFTPDDFEQGGMYCSVLYRTDGIALQLAVSSLGPHAKEMIKARLFSNDAETSKWNHFGLVGEAMVRDL